MTPSSPPPHQTISAEQLLDICAAEKREGRGEFCPFCLAAQTILDLRAALAQTEHFCIRCHHRWQGGLAHSYCGDCHRECQALFVCLAQAEQERDALKDKILPKWREYPWADMRAFLLTAEANREDTETIDAEDAETGDSTDESLTRARGKLRAKAYAQGRADALAQVKALVEKTIIAPSEHAVWRSLKVHIQHQLDAISVSPPQEITEKDVTA